MAPQGNNNDPPLSSQENQCFFGPAPGNQPSTTFSPLRTHHDHDRLYSPASYYPVALSSPVNHQRDFSSPENYSDHQFQIYQSETNGYYNPQNHNLNYNLPDTLDDDSLEIDFNRLTISTNPYRQSTPAMPNSWRDHSIDQMGLLDLRRLRVQSALKGQIDMYNMYMQQNNNYPEINIDLNANNESQRVQRLIRMTNKTPNSIGVLNESQLNSNRNRRRSSISEFLWSGHVRNFESLEEIRGRMCLEARERDGSVFLQKKIGEGKREEIKMVYLELKEHLGDLMVDKFGNLVIQRLLEACDEEQISQILVSVIGDGRSLRDICVDKNGTRAMQTLLVCLTTEEQRSLVISVLRRIAFVLIYNENGHHVIQHCLKLFSIEDKRPLLNVIAANCLETAMDRNGCCVLQLCLKHSDGELQQHFMSEITANALTLSEQPYGNYVVQFILGLKTPHVSDIIFANLKGSYVSLSMDKFGSNVVERCIKEFPEEQSIEVIRELIHDRQSFLSILQDQFGNYVVQSALEISQTQGWSIHSEMVDMVRSLYQFLHSHLFGRKVLRKIKGSKHRAYTRTRSTVYGF